MTRWTITWAGTTWTDEDAALTAADLCRLQILVGDRWRSADPWESPLHLVAMLALLAARDAGVDPLELLPVIQALPAEELLAVLQPREVTVDAV
jgi:hypothetical protein